MAVLDLRVTVADADMPRVLAAARAVFNNPAMTEAEMTELLRQYGIQQMRSMVGAYEKRLAVAAAEALDPQIEVA